MKQLPEAGYFPIVPLILIFTLISMLFPSLSGFALYDLDALDAPISPTHKKLEAKCLSW